MKIEESTQQIQSQQIKPHSRFMNLYLKKKSNRSLHDYEERTWTIAHLFSLIELISLIKLIFH